MTPEQNNRLNHLCSEIAKEQDHTRFHRLVKELNELLDEKEQRLDRRGHDDVMQQAKGKTA